MIACLLSIYTLNNVQNNTNNVNNQVEALNQAMDDKKTQSANQLNQLVSAQQQSMAKQTQEITTQKKALEQLEVKMSNLKNKKQGDDISWKLERIAYLLNMAQLSIHWEQTTTPAIKLLTASDQLVSDLNGPQYQQLRQSLHQEITELQTLPKVDTVGLMSKLSAITQQLTKLPLKSPQGGKALQKVSQSESPQQSKWKKALNTSIDALSKIVVIKKHDEKYARLMSQNEKDLLFSQISINLKQAQWAIIHKEPTIYLANLKIASKTIKDTFDNSAASTQTLLKGIDSLLEENIAPKIPMINKSYSLVIALLQTKKAMKSGAKQ